MKTNCLSIALLFSAGLFAQTVDLSPYQKKTMNTERFARPVNTGVNHTLLILGSAWEVSPELGDEIAVYDSERNMVASVAWRPEQEGHTGLAIWGDDETTSAKEGMTNGETFSIVLFDKRVNTSSVILSTFFTKRVNKVTNRVSKEVIYHQGPQPKIVTSKLMFYT